MELYLLYPTIISIVVLIFLSAFFSSSETALTSLSRAKIHKLKKQGNKSQIMSELRKDKDLLISSILIGNNIVNILASVLTTTLFIKLFSESAIALSTVTMTLLLVIFAEVIPKSYAIYNAEKLSLKLAPFLKTISNIIKSICKNSTNFYPKTNITKT